MSLSSPPPIPPRSPTPTTPSLQDPSPQPDLGRSPRSPSSPEPKPGAGVEAERPALAQLVSLLRHTLRISTHDGRVFLGTFVGTDPGPNVLLAATQEFRPPRPVSEHSRIATVGLRGGFPEGRFVGQIMVPWRFVRKVEVELPPGGGRPGLGLELSDQMDMGAFGVEDDWEDEEMYT